MLYTASPYILCLQTFKALKLALGNAQHPAHYLAIPPALFATVIKRLGAAGLADQARVVVEKPFGRDLSSARTLNRVARAVFPEDSIFRIDHFLAKEAIMNIRGRVLFVSKLAS
jgi:glucose-6-phosphate 1-dehydrogenase